MYLDWKKKRSHGRSTERSGIYYNWIDRSKSSNRKYRNYMSWNGGINGIKDRMWIRGWWQSMTTSTNQKSVSYVWFILLVCLSSMKWMKMKKVFGFEWISFTSINSINSNHTMPTIEDVPPRWIEWIEIIIKNLIRQHWIVGGMKLLQSELHEHQRSREFTFVIIPGFLGFRDFSGINHDYQSSHFIHHHQLKPKINFIYLN